MGEHAVAVHDRGRARQNRGVRDGMNCGKVLILGEPGLPLILASKSAARTAMLQSAGLEIVNRPSGVDERAVEDALDDSGPSPDDVAVVLARAKAETVSAENPDQWVIGADQVLALDGERLHKAADMEEARRRLLKLSGRTHTLHSTVVLAHGGETVWSFGDTASLTMRPLEPGFIGRYLAACGDAVLGSVGAYEIEGRGIQLFDGIEGNHFTIMGMPLLPLLDALRARNLIDA